VIVILSLRLCKAEYEVSQNIFRETRYVRRLRLVQKVEEHLRSAAYQLVVGMYAGMRDKLSGTYSKAKGGRSQPRKGQ
jgi:hypothetical protein